MLPLLLTVALLHPAPPQALTLDQLLVEVSRSAPAVDVQRGSVSVAEAGVGLAGAWDEPTVTVMGEGLPFGSGPFDGTMVTYRIGQPLNLFGRRGAARRAARAQVVAESQKLRRVTSDARAQAVRLFWELWMNQQMTGLLERQIGTLGEMREAGLARVRAGMAMGHHDVLRAQAEIAAMEAERASLADERTAMAAMLNALRGRPQDEAVPEPAAPKREPLPALARLLPLAPESPEVAAMRAMRDEMAARVDLARREAWPMVMVEAEYEQRIGMRDAYGVALVLTIPLWRERARGEVSMARAMERRAERAVTAMSVMASTDLRMAWSRARAAERKLDALEHSALPSMQETVASIEASYRTGAADGFLALLEAVMTLRELEAQALSARIALEWGRAELSRIAGRGVQR